MIRFRPAAARDLAADVRYYEKHYPGRGERFIISAVEIALEQIAASPEFERDIRSAKVARFPYRDPYIVVGSDVDVLAVAHAKRRPAYWRKP